MWQYGKLPSTWEIARIGDYATVITDYVANGSFASLAENVQYRDTPDYAILVRLTDYNSGFNGDFVYIDEHAYEFLSKSKLFGGEIIISNVGANVGTVFKCPTLPMRMSLGPNAIMVKTKGNDDFVYYWFQSRNGQHSLKSIVTGSAQPKFNKTNFRDLLIPVPPKAVQDKIAEYLLLLDQQIENNKRINDNLLHQLQAIYQRMFSQPSHGDMLEGHLSDICAYSQRRVSVGSLSPESYYSTENMLPGKAGAVAASSLPTIAQTTGCMPGDILISNIRPYFKKIVYCQSECGCSTDVLCFVPQTHDLSLYLFSTLYDDHFFDYMVAGSKGTKMPRGDKQQIMAYPIVLPSTTKLVEFNAIARPMLSQIENGTQENKRLASLRDTLLPRLMSGEIDVSSVIL